MINILGVGWAMVLISAMVCTYYNVIIMYSVYYMMVSFVNMDGDLPWQHCDHEWASDLCREEPYPKFDSMTNETDKIKSAMGELISTLSKIQ